MQIQLGMVGEMVNTPSLELLGTLPGPIGMGGLKAVDGRLLFSLLDPEAGTELGASNGTAEGTGLLVNLFSDASGDFPNSSRPDRLTLFNGKVFFQAQSEAGSDIWFSDGTADGTQLLTDLAPGRPLTVTSPLEEVNGRLLFETYQSDTVQRVLWSSDGTAEGTQPISDPENRLFNFGSTQATLGNRRLFSSGGRELWVTDGTAEGTQLLQELAVSTMLPLGDLVLMEASDRNRGYELWVSDGTSEGTRLVKDLRPGLASSAPNLLRAFKGEVYFTAKGLSGEQLWASDGTTEGTRLVKNISPLSGLISRVTSEVNGRLLFVTRTPETGMELWATDGTEAGTQLIQDINPGTASSLIANMTILGDRVVFTASGPDGTEPWVTDGTPEGTLQLKDIYEGSRSYSAGPFFRPVPGFPMPFPVSGSNSSVERPNSSSPLELTVVGDTLYFTALGSSGSRDLWKTDGTPEGTLQVASAEDLGGSRIEKLALLEGDLVFSLRLSDSKRSQLWRLPTISSDPTDPDSTDPEPAEPEPTDLEPTDSEATEPEPIDAEPTEPAIPEPESDSAAPTEPEPTDSEAPDSEVTGAETLDGEATDGEATEPEPTEPESSGTEPEVPDVDVVSEPEPATPELTDLDFIEILGTDASDTLSGSDQADLLVGLAAEDVLWGAAGADRLEGGNGNDQLWGADGDDLLLGQGGDDVMGGDAGDDILIGGAGSDQLMGGPGADRFQLDQPAVGVAPDRIMDFQSGIDRLQLPETITFGQLSFVSQPDGVLIQVDGVTALDVVGASEITVADFVGL